MSTVGTIVKTIITIVVYMLGFAVGWHFSTGAWPW